MIQPFVNAFFDIIILFLEIAGCIFKAELLVIKGSPPSISLFRLDRILSPLVGETKSLKSFLINIQILKLSDYLFSHIKIIEQIG